MNVIYWLVATPIEVVGSASSVWTVYNSGSVWTGVRHVSALLFVLFTCAYIIWVISPPCLPPPPSPLFPSQFQAGHFLPLSLVLLKKRDKPNKEDKVFLLVELRTAIQKYS
jgi:hypothetical protein